MVNLKIEVLSITLSAWLIFQPFSVALAQERVREERNQRTITKESFLVTHERAVREAGIRTQRLLSQENRFFYSYFGTFPGANGLFSHPVAETPDFVQKIVNTDGSTGTISPFRIGPQQYAADNYVNRIPQVTGLGCSNLIPADFNRRPDTDPSPTQ